MIRGSQHNQNKQSNDLRQIEPSKRKFFEEDYRYHQKDEERQLQATLFHNDPTIETNYDIHKILAMNNDHIQSPIASSKHLTQRQSMTLEEEEETPKCKLDFNEGIGSNQRVKTMSQSTNKQTQGNNKGSVNDNFFDHFDINNEENVNENIQFNDEITNRKNFSQMQQNFLDTSKHQANLDEKNANLNENVYGKNNFSVITKEVQMSVCKEVVNFSDSQMINNGNSNRIIRQFDSNAKPKRSETYKTQINTYSPLQGDIMTQSLALMPLSLVKNNSKNQSKILTPIQPLRQSSLGDVNRLIARSFTQKKKNERMNDVWRSRGLFILFFVRKFIVYLKNISQEIKFRSLTQQQFSLINDHANHFDFYKYGNFLVSMQPSFLGKIIFKATQRINQSGALRSRLFLALNFLISKVDIVINPESVIKLLWDGIMLFLLVINIFYIPLKIGFEESAGLKWPRVLVFFLNDVPGWIFIVDTLLNFTTSFYKKGVIIRDRNTIITHYLKNSFAWDIFVLVPFVVSLYFEIKYLDAILLLRFNRILKIFNNYLDLLNLKNQQAAVVDLCKLVMMILFIAHFCGCAFYLLSYFEVQSGYAVNWLDSYNKASGSHFTLDWYSNYITSFYWAVITMITVGYGDIIPVTSLERMFSVFITLISCGVFAYSVNSIGSIIGILTQKNTLFKQRMALLSIHMRKRGLSTDLQMKVKKYFEYLNDESLEDNQEGENMISQLTGSLKHDIALEIYGKILNSKKLFNLNFTQNFLRELAPKLKERRHGPEENIYSQGEINTKIYFIMKGDVNLYMNVRKSRNSPITVIRQINKGGIFGELPFFSGMSSDHGAITTNVVSLVYVNIEDFFEVLQNHPIDREKFALIKDNFNLYSSSRGLGSQCQGCGKYTHQIRRCPMINYIPNKDQIVLKFKKQDEPQVRTNFTRYYPKGLHAYQLLESVQEAVIQMIVEQEHITDIDELYHRIEEMEGFQFINDAETKIIEKPQESSELEEQSIVSPKKKEEGVFLSYNSLESEKRRSELKKNQMKNGRVPFDRDNKQSKLMTYLQKSSGQSDDIIEIEDSSGGNSNPPQKIRKGGRKISYLQKLQGMKGYNQSYNEEDEQDNKKRKRDNFIKQITCSPNISPQKKSAPISSLTASILKDAITTTRGENYNTETLENQQKILKFSKMIDLDMPKEYKIYYPKNNFTNTIRSYNFLLKIKKNTTHITENPIMKEFYKTMIMNPKGHSRVISEHTPRDSPIRNDSPPNKQEFMLSPLSSNE